MPRIPSANADFQRVGVPGEETGYVHPAQRRKGPVPLAFQVTSPLNRLRVLMPHALVMHVNPSSLSETHMQKIERFQTRGGWVEQHWGNELTEVSADQTTGAFMNIYTGLTSVLRRQTIAWDRYRDLHDLYKNNGSLIDPAGSIVLQGHVMLMYDRGTFLGTFRTFEVGEADDSPFAFKLSWTFKIEHTILLMANVPGPAVRPPTFQSQNLPTTTGGAGFTSVEQTLRTPEAEVAGRAPVTPSDAASEEFYTEAEDAPVDIVTDDRSGIGGAGTL